jgi:truncated hemoglobin YjbI
MTTAYEALGGEAKVRAVLDALYEKLFADPMVGFLFDGKDKAHIVEQQLAFTCRFLGGPQRYVGKPLPEAHAALPLLPGHFDRRHHLLRQVLADEAVPDDVAGLWLRIDESLRASVLAAGAEARDQTRARGE